MVPGFANRVRRVPPVCSTIRGGNRELCSLTERKVRIRHRDQGIAICSLSLTGFSRGTRANALRVSYSGNACMHAVVSSVNEILNINTIVATLYEASTYKFSLSRYVALSRLGDVYRGKGIRRGLHSIRDLFVDLNCLTMSSTRTGQFTGNNTLDTSEACLTGSKCRGNRLFEVGARSNSFLNVNVTSGPGGLVGVCFRGYE